LKVLETWNSKGDPAHTTKGAPSMTWDDPAIWRDPALLV